MARSRRTGRILFALIVAAILGGGAWWFLRPKAEAAPQFRSMAVDRGQVTQTVAATGQLKPVVSVEVSSQVSGRLMDVLVDFNTVLKKGDVLARIDPATFESAVSQAENELLNAKANLRLMRSNAARSRQLFEQQLISDADLDQVNAQLEEAEVNVRIREAALESRRTDLARCTIYSPIDGIVISRNIEMGQTVAASLNAPTLFVLAEDLARMQINAPVAEADIGQVREGLAVAFTVDAYPGERFTGTVTQVRNSPQTTDGVVSYATIIDVANSDLRLKPGMTANVSVIVAERASVLRVANAALRLRLPDPLRPPDPPVATPPSGPEPTSASNGNRQPGGERPANPWPAAGAPNGFPAGGAMHGSRGPANARILYRLGGTEKAPALEALRVRTGITDGTYTEIQSGLEEGDRIVTGLVVSGAPTNAPSSPFGSPGGFRRF